MAVDDVCKGASKDIPETSMACFRSYVYIVDLDTGAIEQVTDGLVFDFAPAWAPDGSAIAFGRFPFPTAENSAPDPQTLLVDPADRSISQLQPAGQTWATDFSWSPDGDELLLHDGDGHVDVLDLGTMEVTHLATATVSDRELGDPTWSPDGEKVVFTRTVNDVETLFMIDAEGGEAQELVPGCCATWAAQPAPS